MEWHGWATIVATPGVEDDPAADRAQHQAEEAIAALLTEPGKPSGEFYDLRSQNGLRHLTFNGSHNHYPVGDGPVEFARTVASIAPGSYGVLYILDDDHGQDWQRWIMRRGQVTLERDDSLSPHIGKVEDPE